MSTATGQTHHVELTVSGVTYELTLAKFRGAYRELDINDWAPKIATGDLGYSQLTTWNVTAQEDFRHGFGHRIFKDEAGYHKTVGSIDTRHKDVVQLATAITASDEDLAVQTLQFIDFGGNLYAALDGTGLGSELLSNTGFETAGAGGSDVFGTWTEGIVDDSSITDEGVVVHGGSHAAKLSRASSGSATLYQTVAVSASTRYTLAFWARGDGTNAGRYDVIYTGGYVVDTASTGVTGSSYAQVVKEFVTPSDCTEIDVYLYSSTANSSDAYFDDISLKAGTGYGIRKFTTSTSTWAPVTDSDLSGKKVYCLLDNGAYLFAGVDGGQVLKSSDGSSWTTTGADANAADYRYMALGGGKMWASKDDDNHVHWASTIDGTDWEGDENDTRRVTVGPGDPTGANTATPITGMAWFNGGLHVAREDGLWVIPEAEPTTAYRLLDWSSEQRSTNGKGMIVWKDKLIIPKGPQLFAFTGTGISDITPPPIGQTFPYTSYGNFEALAAFGPYLYVAAQEGASAVGHETLRPNAVGSSSELDVTPAGSDHYAAVDEETADYFTSTVYRVGGVDDETDLYELEASGLSTETISKVTLYATIYVAIGMVGGTATFYGLLRPTSTTRQHTTSYSYTGGQDWTTLSWEWTTNPDDDSTWIVSDLAGLEAGIRITNNHTTIGGYCTQLWVQIEYEDDVPYRLLCWDGAAWHNIGDLDGGGKYFYVSPATDDLWINDYDSTNANYNTRYMQLQEHSFLPKDDYPTTGTHSLYLSRLDSGLKMIEKCWHEWQIHSENLTADRYLTAYYRTSGETWISLENVTQSPYQAVDLSDIQAKYLDLRLDFVTDDSSESPILEGWAIQHLAAPDALYGYAVTIRIGDYVMGKDGRTRRKYTWRDYITAMRDARDSKIPITFTTPYGEDKTVRVSTYGIPDLQPTNIGGRWTGLLTLNLVETG